MPVNVMAAMTEVTAANESVSSFVFIASLLGIRGPEELGREGDCLPGEVWRSFIPR